MLQTWVKEQNAFKYNTGTEGHWIEHVIRKTVVLETQ